MPPHGTQFSLRLRTLDGGLNLKDAPSNIEDNESQDCLNVTFDDRGAVQTRLGCAQFNTSTAETGSFVVDGLASYNGSLVAWAGGSMYYASGTTFVTVPSAQAQFTAGQKVAHVVYQNMLICSDGSNGPYRYHSPSDFYRLGIATPSAPTAASNLGTSTGGGPETGTYYYKISYANTGVVEGEVGSAAVALTLGTTAVVNVTSIPTGSASLGVAYRYVYRASSTSGPYRRVGTISDNAASIFTDTMGATTWAVQVRDVVDASSLPVFTTVKLHKEHLWIDDGSDRTLLRYTDYGVPYISAAENFIPLSKGDLSYITAIEVQDDLVTAFKGKSTWLVDLVTPGDPSTYSFIKSPSNIGIVGPRALIPTNNGILFMGQRDGRITGIHLLAGTEVMQTSDSKLRTESISERLESDILALSSTYWPNIAFGTFNNAIFVAVTRGSDTQNKNIYWFDINRLGSEGQPGSWSLWDGRSAQVSCFTEHSGSFYGGSSLADGKVLQLMKASTYNDAGTAIRSYWWSKQFSGDDEQAPWVKDWRRLNVWFSQLGNYYMTVRYRVDGDSGEGSYQNVNLAPGGAVFDTDVWDSAVFAGSGDSETQLNLGQLYGRRIAFGITNSGVSGATDVAFKVYQASIHGTLRRVY